jgi:hypothetical protein
VNITVVWVPVPPGDLGTRCTTGRTSTALASGAATQTLSTKAGVCSTLLKGVGVSKPGRESPQSGTGSSFRSFGLNEQSFFLQANGDESQVRCESLPAD